jgi:hypothetical protein
MFKSDQELREDGVKKEIPMVKAMVKAMVKTIPKVM